MSFETSDILIAFITFFVATASPGPATIAIMDIAMSKGQSLRLRLYLVFYLAH